MRLDSIKQVLATAAFAHVSCKVSWVDVQEVSPRTGCQDKSATVYASAVKQAPIFCWLLLKASSFCMSCAGAVTVASVLDSACWI